MFRGGGLLHSSLHFLKDSLEAVRIVQIKFTIIIGDLKILFSTPMTRQ